MTTPVNTFQDILDAMEREPTLRDTLRRHILTEELIQLPAQFAEHKAEFVELNANVAVLKTSVAELKTGMARLETNVATNGGPDDGHRLAIAQDGVVKDAQPFLHRPVAGDDKAGDPVAVED